MRKKGLVLVAGPSGAGKDTLIAHASRRLAGDGRFVFLRRTVTRPALAEAEDHLTLTPEAFAEQRRGGVFALHWTAHGLHYGIAAADIAAALSAGCVPVASVSRAMLAQAAARYPGSTVILVDAAPTVRALRLAQRGREDPEAIARRLGRESGSLPPFMAATIVDNSGPLEDGIARFVAALRRAA